MPYALLFIGIILFVSGVRGTNATLWNLVKSDFTGENNFLIWLGAIAIVGGAGYIKPLKPLSIAFMTLLLVSLVLKNGGVFQKLQEFIQNPSATEPNNVTPIPATSPLPALPQLPSINASSVP